MSSLNIALLTVGMLVLVLGLLSEPLKRSLLSTPLVALVVGVLIGPAVTGALDVASWGSQEAILEQAARLTLGISLMGIALRLPRRYVLEHWRPLALLLGPVMVLMWLASGLLAFLLLGLPFWAAMLIGAVVTPTDPVIASSIVTGGVADRNLPGRVRHLLSGESGANDGLAYPLVFISILMLQRPAGEALGEWVLQVVLWEVTGAVVLGAVIGYGAGWLLEKAEASGMVERTSFLAYTIALSVAVLGGAKLLGTDGVLAVFAAGLAFSMAVEDSYRVEEESEQEAVNSFFTLPVFALLGMSLPFGGWWDLGWVAPALVVGILLLRRLPALAALSPLVSGLRDRKDVLFFGWFGPIGVAALFYATLALRETGVEEAWTVGSLLITASIVVHGVSAAPLTRLYGRKSRQTGE
ncbi:cation:proton antiporter domain-containing protein [Rubrobacter aplysinae]|uniref:cation:proton antiporter domain-containing protein n=1 Tax=Rubrobacter aplysinae TaxID=909625 RepID=UPI000AD6A86B|nr:cation:proton antiporter [Rubrobacter aplysinae]